jgi:hypothetical protein
MNYDPEFEEK